MGEQWSPSIPHWRLPVRNFLIGLALALLTLPAFAHGPMIIIEGVTAPHEGGNNYGPAIVIEEVAYGPMLGDGPTNNNGPMIIIEG